MRNDDNTSRVEADEAGTSLARHWASDLATVVDLIELSGLSKVQNSKRL